jgi:hypothetical protein
MTTLTRKETPLMIGSHRRRLAAVALVLATALTSSSVTAQDDATRTLAIFAVGCSADSLGDASDAPCDGLPMSGIAFRAGRPFTDFVLTGQTDEAGMVTFDIAGLPLDGIVRVIEELPLRTERFLASCVNEAGDPLAITHENLPQNVPPLAVAYVTVGDTGDVRCDWYNAPAT